MSFRFLDENYIDLNILAEATFSSEQSAFPAANVYNKQRRSKVWRSNGYWELSTAATTLVFRETSAGPDLTATIVGSPFTTTSSFIAALKSALDTAGASTYTVTQNSDFKFVITSDGAGGAGDFEPKFATSTAIASVLGFEATDRSGALTYEADELRIHTDEWLKWDFGLAGLPTAFVMAGPRNAPLKISPNSTIKLQGNETDIWTSPTYEETLTYNDNVISAFDSTGLHTEALRFWRLQIVDQNPLGYVELGAAFLGQFYQSTTGQPQFPFRSSPIDRSETAFSEGGQSFTDVREQSEAFAVRYLGLTKTERDRMLEVFEFQGLGTPFFIHMDPNAAYFLDSPTSIRFVKFATPPTYELASPNNWTMDLELREEL